MHLFYTPDIEPSISQYFLNEEESKHAVRVLRLSPGDEVQLIDGRGGFYIAHIKDAHPKRTILDIASVTTEYQKRNHYLHIAVAPTKNIERLEWFLEKATEIGIDEVSLIICQRSERKEARADRLNRIITSAVKQSIKAYHPILNEATPFNKFVSSVSEGQKFIAHCAEGTKQPLKTLIETGGSYTVLIGPEGDFTSDEINTALNNGYKAITLGDSRLRTETAALEACFEVNFLNR
ncbi:16S rRNA (uracil(1498)-N(3))-methyltransferase [Mucilaginibacter limnophilus]|uniref:Ribosomal RNA small subunit methyltransferase E n=1 Tax=Mucilaginibacter limnophilus TaxID=1932778 RepID=A0A3S2UMB7_9SPHI|nr:16S rRNA (uracil(1498)-N(3))-methyltransferase [Mucilaginibacter limnophilus]RVU01854.1 16S rRNA (uracil(1498)-N(3))-methyltransferase [Mucilaginibacter limnophilus]